MKEKKCPCGNGSMNLEAIEEKTIYKGVSLEITSKRYICPKCGIEAGTIEQAAAIQACVADSYREKTGLLSGSEIKKMRIAAGLKKEQLADLLGVSEREIKGWETCITQSRQEDKSLRMVLKERGSYEVTQWPEFPGDE